MPDDKGNAALLTKEFVPQDLHDRAYLKDLLEKPWDKETAAAVFKKLDGAETLIGKRPAIPARDAKPEDLLKHFEVFAEEKAESYEVPVEKDAKIDPNFIKAVQTAFHAGKISKVQAGSFLKVINEFGNEQRKAAAQAKQKSDLEFNTLAKTYLGAENKAVMERVQGLLKQYAPAAAAGALGKLSDEQVVVMGAIVDAIHKKYASEDDVNGKAGDTGKPGATTAAEKRQELRKVMTEKGFSNWQASDHDALNAKAKQLSKEIADLEK